MSEENLGVDLKAGFGFDPEWTYDQAEKAGDDGPRSPFFRWNYWQQINGILKEEYKNGNKRMLLLAMEVCAKSGLPMPKWVSEAYLKGYNRLVFYEFSLSLDDIFDFKKEKGIHKNTILNKRKTIPLYKKIEKMKDSGRPVDRGLFEDAGREFGISGSAAEKIYYERVKTFNLLKKALFPESQK